MVAVRKQLKSITVNSVVNRRQKVPLHAVLTPLSLPLIADLIITPRRVADCDCCKPSLVAIIHLNLKKHYYYISNVSLHERNQELQPLQP
jgi:hypothetical protein